MLGLTLTLSAALFSLAHLLVATTVTLHVLYFKRDAGSSAAWIGLAWLAPFSGSTLYYLLGINRVRRRAITQVGMREPKARSITESPTRCGLLFGLERAGQYITQRSAVLGNEIRLLRSGDDAYPPMIAAIDGAMQSIALASYIYRNDDIGNTFSAALIRANARGVQTRVLIDGFGGGYFSCPTYRQLRKNGVPVAQFMHSSWPWRMPFLNLRSHKKILVIDGRVAFTGGLNIGNENSSARQPRHSVIDSHFEIVGPVVAQVVEVFAQDWHFTTDEQLAGEHWFPSLKSTGECIARAVTSGPDQDMEKIELLILAAIGCAKSSIKIMTPYFLPDSRLITALTLAAFRGVIVDVILPLHSNHPVLDWAARGQIQPLLAAGCRIWTHPPPFDHSKLMSVDRLWCLIGSANWDMRSFRLNFELDLEVYDSDLATRINNLMSAQQVDRFTVEMLLQRSKLAVLRDSVARLMLPYL